jgi:hypothetical protein
VAICYNGRTAEALLSFALLVPADVSLSQSYLLHRFAHYSNGIGSINLDNWGIYAMVVEAYMPWSSSFSMHLSEGHQQFEVQVSVVIIISCLGNLGSLVVTAVLCCFSSCFSCVRFLDLSITLVQSGAGMGYLKAIAFWYW